MVDVYQKVRGGIESVSDSNATTEELKQVAKEVKELGTVDASFSRGQLYLLEDEVVFAQSINESTINNFLDNILSKGPINPLRTLGIYKPFKTSLKDSDQYAGTWRLPYSEIEAVSLLSKGNGYEVFLRRDNDPKNLYRIRNEEGTDYIGFRWLYSPNHDTAVQMAGELFDQAMRYGGVEEFNPGGHFPGRTKQVEFAKGESKYAGKEPIEQPSSSTEAESSNISREEPEIADSNISSDTSHVDKNSGQEVVESDKNNKFASDNSSVEQSSQSNTTEASPETPSVETGTQSITSTEANPRSADLTTSKRRWTYLILGIVLVAVPPVVPTLGGGLLLGNTALIPILGLVGIIGLILILFGIYRIIRY